MSAATMNEMDRLVRERDALAEKLAVATKRLEDGHLAPVGWISGDRYEAVSREKMDYRRRWKEVCEERDALVNRVDFLNQQNSAQQEQNDELAAHVERKDDILRRLVAAMRAYEMDVEPDFPPPRNHREMMIDADAALAETPATSLARLKAEELMNGATPCPDGGKCHKSGLTCGDPICEEWGADLKAQWQAEALEKLADNFAEAYAERIRYEARELRRQAQDPTNGHH